MKKSILIVSICMLFMFQSCQSQSFDLEKVKLPVKQADLKELGLASTAAGVGTEEVQYTTYSSAAAAEGKMAISFGKIKIKLAENSESFTQGPLYMYAKNNGDSFEGYQINVGDSNNLSELIQHFLTNKDTYKLVYDQGKDTGERARIFLNDQNKTNYLVLSIDNDGKKSGYVEAISYQEAPLLSARLGGAFGYYAEYLVYKKNKPASFSYLDFLKELDNEIYNENNNLK